MPPLFTATNGLTLLRKVVHSARTLSPSISTRSAVTSRLSRAQRARIAFRAALHETYASLHTSTFQPLKSGHSALAPQAASSSRASSPLGTASRVFRGSGFRLSAAHPRGPAIVGSVGLSPARNFSTGPAQTMVGNAPVFLRALISLDDENLPKANRYIPYRRPPKTSKWSRASQVSGNRYRRRSACSTSSSRSSWLSNHIQELEHYFPAPLRSPAPADLPLCPEQLITPGSTATLSIALSPSLHDLLQPTTEISYREAELGLSIFTDLLKGVPAVLEAFSIHGCTRVYPLLSKLASLGLLDVEEGRDNDARLEILTDHEARPDIMNIVFPKRSERDVRQLLGETLRIRDGEMQWYALYETRAPKAVEAAMDTAQLIEHWDDEPRSSQSASTPTPQEDRSGWTDGGVGNHLLGADSACDLVFPVISFDQPLDLADPQAETSFIDTPPESYSWPSSGVSTPFTPTSPMSIGSPSLRPASALRNLRTEILTSEDGASNLSESLVSQLDSASHSVWSVSLSVADSDVESSYDLSELGDVESVLWSEPDVDGSSHRSVQSQQDLERSWTESEQMFDLAQPW